MQLPFQPPLLPMLSKASDELPEGEGWLYEPKWDGFRALVFKSGDDVVIQSRDTKPLGRYFPELEATLRAKLPERCVLDGEVVIATDGRLDFEAMLMRIHPAASRVKMLAEQSPSSYVAWDLLALGDEDLRALGQLQRRERLETALAGIAPPIHVTRATRDRALAADWFARFEGAGLDGVMAKPIDLVYTPGKRVMLKIKHQRTADCVVAGFRWYKGGKGKLLGSMLLGLYDDQGKLHHVGVCSGFKMADREKLADLLRPLSEGDARATHPWRDWAEFQDEAAEAPNQRMPGGQSRWTRGKDLSWVPIRIERTCEVSYDHLQGTRFRHGTHFKRWRPDKAPSDCRYDQLEVTPPYELAQIFGHHDG
ncbi:MAG: ATP-dependent DNA ligase [Deltaproteobacteria bacterium]|nr:ATP-dependent DNA ligase [Deltaproteobacteria bacterium]